MHSHSPWVQREEVRERRAGRGIVASGESALVDDRAILHDDHAVGHGRDAMVIGDGAPFTVADPRLTTSCADVIIVC